MLLIIDDYTSRAKKKNLRRTPTRGEDDYTYYSDRNENIATVLYIRGQYVF